MPIKWYHTVALFCTFLILWSKYVNGFLSMTCKTLCDFNLHYISPITLHLPYCTVITATLFLFKNLGIDPASGPLYLLLPLPGAFLLQLVSAHSLTSFSMRSFTTSLPITHFLLPLPCFTTLHDAFHLYLTVSNIKIILLSSLTVSYIVS